MYRKWILIQKETCWLLFYRNFSKGGGRSKLYPDKKEKTAEAVFGFRKTNQGNALYVAPVC